MSKEVEKIRILLVNNSLTSLFMASYLRQLYERKPEFQTIAIYTDIDFDKTSWESTWNNKCIHLEEKKRFEEKGCKLVLKDYVSGWIRCMPKRYFNYQFNWRRAKELFQERAIRKTEIKFIKQIFDQNKILCDSVIEIWYSNSSFIQHFFYLCSNATGIRFEHGLGDVYQVMLSEERKGNEYKSNLGQAKWFKIIKHNLKNKIQNFLLYFSPEIINEKQHVSLLGDEIQSASSKWNVKTLDSEITLDTVESSLKSENMIYDNKNNLALIMMPDIMILTQDKQQQMDFYKAFEKYLIESCDGLFIKYQIDILIFKAKLYLDNYFEEGFNNFLYLKKKYELKYLPHLSRINLPVELYLPIFKPNLILGAYGSALFYSKKLYPDVVTYSFDKWYNKYCDDHFGTHIKEYDTLINFFHGKYSKEFREILPIRF